MKAREYYAAFQAAILAAPHVIRSDITFDEVTDSECYVRGILTMTGEIELHLAEYIVTDPAIKRLKYRYHLQTLNGKLLARWDNAPHHPEVNSHLTICIETIKSNHLKQWISKASLQR